MRNDNNRRRNHRNREGSEPQAENNQPTNIAENKPVDTPKEQQASADSKQETPGKNNNAGNNPNPNKNGNGNKNGERKGKDNNRKRGKANGERLLKDPGLVHAEGEEEEDREYFDTMTAEELEEVTNMMRKKTAAVDKQDLESNVPAGEDWEPYLDMDIRTGVSYEADSIAANIFHTRGLKGLPNPEHAHCQQYQYSSCKLPSVNWMDNLDISLEHLEFPARQT